MIAQRRNINGHDVQAVVEILAESAFLERGVTLSTGTTLTPADIYLDDPAKRPASGSPHVLPPGMTLEQWEDETIREALRRANGNKSQAARALGLSRNALRYRLSKLGVPDSPDKENTE